LGNFEDPLPQSSWDLVVVGSGIAGLYASLLAAESMRVLLVSKVQLEESNTRYAQGGIAAALSEGDSPELHTRDTIAAGDGLCDPEAVRALTGDAPHCIQDLLRRGVSFDRDGAGLAWTLEAAHSLPRVLHAGGDATGAKIERTLVSAVRSAGVRVLENVFCGDLTTRGDVVTGVVLQMTDGSCFTVEAPRVLLATGGAGQLFSRTTNPEVATGDGLALAYRAGAELADLEFTQFHPTAFALEGAPSFLISEAVRGEGGILRDSAGRAFMEDFHPDRELAPRDVVARAIHTQMQKTESNHVWLDVQHLPSRHVEKRFPSIMRFCRGQGIEPLREPIPVAPAAHYMMGGIRTDSAGRTTVPGLLACGEVACTGVHGANRLASNSLLEGLVFARRAVLSLVEDFDGSSLQPASGRHFSDSGPVSSSAVASVDFRASLRECMWRDAGLVRSAGSLSSATQQVAESRHAGLAETVAEQEASNLALVSALVVSSASIRQESRGAHYRSDFPSRDSAWLGRTVVSREGFSRTPLGAADHIYA
jgi:L-aspartate oxidase